MGLLRTAVSSPGAVTLLGPGGAGKTRLLRELSAERPDAVTAWLSGITDPELLTAAVARAVGCSSERVAIGRALAHRDTSLLMLDNLEQLGVEGARFISELLGQAPRLTVLTTSRTRLELEGESVVPVDSLPLADGVRLVLEHLARRAPGQVFDPVELLALVEALDALPLALELAAARIPALGLAGVRKQLARRLDLLVGSGPDRPAHHRDLRTAVAGSWDLLTTPQRRALKLLVFLPQAFVLDDLAAFPDPELPLHVAALVDGSLLRVEAGSDAVYHHYETVRAFVREQVPADDPLHSDVVDGLCSVAEPLRRELHGPNVGDAVTRLLRLRSALMEAAELAEVAGRTEDFARLVTVLDPVLHQHGPGAWRERNLKRVTEWLPPTHPLHPEAVLSLLMTSSSYRDARALEFPASVLTPSLEARRRTAHAKLLFDLGRLREAGEVAATAAEGIDETDRRAFLGAAWIRAGIHSATGRLEAARAAYSEGLRVARDAQSHIDEALFLGQLGSVLLDLGDDDAPRALLASVSLLERHQDFRRALWMLRLGELHVDGGRPAEGLAMADASLEVMRNAGQLRFEGYALAVRARALEGSSRVTEALDCWERSRDRGGHAILGGTIESWYGRALADAGHADAARAAIGRSRAVFSHLDSKLAPLPELCGAHVDLLEARLAEAQGSDPEPARARVQQLLQRLVPGAHEVRAAHHRLADTLARDRGPDGITTPADGAWLQFDGVRTDLSTRHAIRRVWNALVAAHAAQRHLGVEALFEVGWPGERAHPDAARDRVYHAIGTLRRAGLQEALARTEAGWSVQPGVSIRIV